MSKQRLSKTELAARAACAQISANGRGVLELEWVRSRAWGRNPQLRYHGTTIARASGCGYNKESTVLATALCWLGPDEHARHCINATARASTYSLIPLLAEYGWTLAHTHSGRTFDTYLLTRIENERPL